ncbi:transporter [Nocardia neocaledoniensis NBRC 108232]|uniref:BASS family bile acid:Na+ symporter n=1 Tax=Nocardia neocaledoniensis TaxID=236511 RepID=A0A317N7J5_9NOCA|nr:bile acid:sodium symporter family protein [Nocardia neocaledoniensis]PWV71024.1 BASS family bile acid:Na+ symporter [Nocardia neocaledoniensis]GEM30314.1 transporter [Nocardia neocaledoniensis NBRC 108232]
MNSPLVSLALPVALAIIMFGLGLTLTVQDFTRILRHPAPVAVALACQLLLLPLLAFAVVLAFDLPPVLAVGMMLLAASPGGTTANVFSHLFRGDIALNISLTALNSVLAVVTIPVVTNLALAHFLPEHTGDTVGLQFGKVAQVFAIVLIPIAMGMLQRHLWPDFAARLDRPVRVASVVILGAVVLGTITAERDHLTAYLLDVGAAAAVFCLASLIIGYVVPRAFGVEDRQAIACSMEIGIHNSTVAITIAAGVLGSVELAVPAAVYGVLMFPLAACTGWLITRRIGRRARPSPVDAEQVRQ